MAKKTMYEISNDPITDTHILVPSGYAGLSDKELQEMEDQVRKANKLRTQQQEEIVRIKLAEQARLKALDEASPAYKEQWEKSTGKKLGEVKPYIPPERTGRGEQRQPVGGKAGCSSCAKKGLMGLIKGGAKLLKSELGIDAADEATMAKRKETCLGCPIYDFGVCVEEDGGCGCFVAAKIKLKGEECPKGKW